MFVYVVGQLMFCDYGSHYMQRKLLPALRASGANVIQPVSLAKWKVGFLATAVSKTDQTEFWKWLNDKMRVDIRAAIDRADVVVAVLDGNEPHCETLAEIRYASARCKPIFGLLNNVLCDAYNEASPIYPEADLPVKQSGGAIYRSLPALAEALAHEREDRRLRTKTEVASARVPERCRVRLARMDAGPVHLGKTERSPL